MAPNKLTTRTTVTLEDDLKAWLEAGAARNRRDFSAHLNAVLEEARSRDGQARKRGESDGADQRR